MNEAETRAEYIDPALKLAGWGVVENSRIRREYAISPGRIEGHGKSGKALIADYILEFRNTKLAVVEAKAWNEALTEGVAQAKNYAQKLAIRFAYSSNGQGIYEIDMKTGEEREISGYPTPQELWNRTFAEQDAWRDRFADVAYEDKGGTHPGRYYQDIAIERVLSAIAANQQRILLTLATGTGKTFIAFQIAWKLFHARWNLSREPSRRPRILFLADRNILANQAYNAFSAFAEDALVRIAPDEIRKKGKVPTNGSLFFTIFQTFMCENTDSKVLTLANSVQKPATPYYNFGEYPPDFFDLIIIDECHRGGARDESNWRGILEYFAPAVQLGLTATPKRKDNVDTYLYFGSPVYTYSLKEGINDGFLTPFRLKQISTTLDDYVYTSDDRVVEGEIEAGKRYDEDDFNRIIEIREREAYRVKLFMSQINQQEKTLVFCATQLHALVVRDLINQLKTSTDPDYCQRVTANDGALGEQYLREFQDNEKTIPTILTTSEKLSTGVDARNVRNIVLMRPVNSMIEFKQIIGRGTRLYDGKDYFTIYDFVKAYYNFQDPEWDGEPQEPEPCKKCSSYPCVCEKAPPKPCETCGKRPCECPKEPCVKCGKRPCVCVKKTKIKLASGKERTIQHMMCTSFWHPDGTPMSSTQFLEALYGRLPEFFKDEDELRKIWSAPDTRKQLLEGLSEQGFGY
ncbi:MAG TPA: DEAD/DEAH box helicase family protein [Candidatus Rifleibacterium sp.]|nr:DEAD/DEAH box helicase family protein [Candidatus Rifleibacterium sp.]